MISMKGDAKNICKGLGVLELPMRFIFLCISKNWQTQTGWLCVLGATICVGLDSAYAQPLYIPEQKLTASDSAPSDHFGISLLVDGNRAVIGASLDNCPAGIQCGSAYIFRSNGTGWVEEQKLTASDASGLIFFGESVSLSGDIAVAGAAFTNCADGDLCGSAYVFRFDGTSWVEEQILIAYDAAMFDFFGGSVSASGNKIIVGAGG